MRRRSSPSRTAVDDESAAGSRADDCVLVGLDGAEHVLHPGRPAAAQTGDKGGKVLEGGVPFVRVRGEHLVPVVADPTAGPPIPAAACQAHRVGVGRPEERLSRGERQSMSSRRPSLSVRPSRPTYTGSELSALTMLSEAQVQTEATQGAQAGGQPADLHIPLQRLLAQAAGCPARSVETGRTGRRSTARGSPRWPRSAARHHLLSGLLA